MVTLTSSGFKVICGKGHLHVEIAQLMMTDFTDRVKKEIRKPHLQVRGQ